MQTLASRTGAKYFSETPKLVVLNRQILNGKTSRKPFELHGHSRCPSWYEKTVGFIIFSYVLEGA
jgi:hypothetical protein